MNPAEIRHIPILCYHKIERRAEWGLNTCKPEHFRQHLQFLKENDYRPTNFLEINSGKLPRKPVIITFDDGYSSVYQNAFPILQSFGFTAIVYIVTSYIGKLNTWDANLGRIYFRHLDEVQICKLADAGIECGSHGQTHRAFTYLREDEAGDELKKSRDLLWKLTGREILSIAYPFGLQNKKIRRLASGAGYRFGCSNLWGKPLREDLLFLKRIPVYRGDSLNAFRRKLSSGFTQKREFAKLYAISWSARLTPVYQKFFSKEDTPCAE